MKWNVLLGVMVVATVSQPADAEWTGVGNLRYFNVSVDGGGNSIQLTHDNMKNPAGCANGAYMELRADSAGFNEMYSLLLSAKTADRQVDIFVSDSVCTPSGYPQITQASYNYTAGGGSQGSLPLATTSLDGLMSASDKAKLDGLNLSFNGALFKQSGSWVAPSGVHKVKVLVVGAGGAGSDLGGENGGVGGFAYGFVDVTPGQTYTVTVGVGGTGGAYATGGSASDFGGLISATGGAPGSGYSTGADGTGTGGSLRIGAVNGPYIPSEFGGAYRRPGNESTAPALWGETSTVTAPGAGGGQGSSGSGGVGGIVYIEYVGG